MSEGSNEPDPQEGTLDGESLKEKREEAPDTEQKDVPTGGSNMPKGTVEGG